jgi:hypothetical protein
MSSIPPRASNAAKAVWLLLGGLLLIVAPSQIWLGEPVWHRGAGAVVRAVGFATAYWIGAGLLRSVDQDRSRPSLPALSSAAVPLAALYLAVMILSPSYSRGVFLVATGLLGLLTAAPWLLARRMQAASSILVGALVVVLGLGVTSVPPPDESPVGAPADTLFTHHGRLVGTHLTDVGDDTIRGGGLSRVGDDMLLVTGAGEFFRIELGNGRVRAELLSLRAPLNRDDFIAATDTSVRRWRFRVAGIFTQPMGDSVRVLVSHHFWKTNEGCFVFRLSETTLPAGLGASASMSDSGSPARWRTLFETTPCLGMKDQGDVFAGQQAGGRIAALGDTALILTVGDHQFDGVHSSRVLSQDPANDYGKTVLIPRNGPARIFTLGHRNPQGMVVTEAGEIWITEHGPRGGDELNLLVDGANYGWPLQTLGTLNEELAWPLTDSESSGRRFAAPDFAWVPSIGISNLIEIRTDAMSGWRGDLLVASLAGRSLYRLDRDDSGRIVYAEQIQIKARVRDLAEAADGRLVVWFDDARLSVFTPIDPPEAGPPGGPSSP